MHKMSIIAFSPVNVHSLKPSPLKRLFLPRKINESWLLHPVVCCKSCLFIYLYAVTPFLCSTLYNKHVELPGCCGFSSWEARLFKASFLFVCVCLLPFPNSSVRPSSGAMMDNGKGDVLYIISYFGVLVTVFCKSLCIHILRIYFTTHGLKSPATVLCWSRKSRDHTSSQFSCEKLFFLTDCSTGPRISTQLFLC